MKYPFLTIIILFFSTSFLAQSENKLKFNEISSQIDKLLKYKEKSPSQLRGLLADLKSISKGMEAPYNQMKIRVDGHILDVDIKLVRSDIYNDKFDIALRRVPELKLYYPFSDKITSLETFTDRKSFKYYRKEVQDKRSSYLSLEPSFSGYIPEYKLSSFGNLFTNNVQPVYGIGIYYKINPKVKSAFEYSNKPKFMYSQVGIKVDHFDATKSIIFDSLHLSPLAQQSYNNFQISFLIRKCLGLDFGFINSKNTTSGIINIRPKSVYNSTVSFYIPLNVLSIGVNARILTDFKDYNRIQYGLSLKFNIGILKPFPKKDREEIKTKILKIKGI